MAIKTELRVPQIQLINYLHKEELSIAIEKGGKSTKQKINNQFKNNNKKINQSHARDKHAANSTQSWCSGEEIIRLSLG